ncbi:MAG: hypothetical protein A2583_10975 [Bdellovibrionales bacterium RIFOXYD1_FULL_53_11]|nr:MAG: hypothetical protein A2583_10975 [Bdellovibrionales bacterium RIFOXYD1_FULL_53_11]
MPCLNESRTLPKLLEECNEVFTEDALADWEILLADNGSTDGSREIARKHGARVVDIPRKGYGSAVHGGIIAAETTWVAYADADGTYSPRDAVKLLHSAVKYDADLAMGSRITGTIHKGAMPLSHRYLGTPVLSLLIRLLYGICITDCNSGIRCLKKESFVKWRIKSRGMEFASAILIKAANHEANIIEEPVMLRRDLKGRTPHLRAWHDGMRHLLVVLAGAPWLFWYSGITMLLLSVATAIPCIWGPFKVTPWFGIFGAHTMAVSITIGFFGSLCFNMAQLIYVRAPSRRPIPDLAFRLLNIPEGLLFWLLVSCAATFGAAVFYLFYRWYLADFGGINFIKLAMFAVYFAVVPTSLIMGVFHAHLDKRVDV